MSGSEHGKVIRIYIVGFGKLQRQFTVYIPVALREICSRSRNLSRRAAILQGAIRLRQNEENETARN